MKPRKTKPTATNPATDDLMKSNEQTLIDNAKNEILDLKFHAETLGMEIQGIIAKNPNPAVMTNISQRKILFNSVQELREINKSISAKEYVLNQYIERGNGQ